MTALRAKRHKAISIHVSDAAYEALLDTPDRDEAVKFIADNQLHHWYVRFPTGRIPNINAIYGDDWALEGTHLLLKTCCKVRTYTKADGHTGWIIGIVTAHEWQQIMEVDVEEVNDLSAKMLGLTGKDLLRWCERYG